MNGALPPALLAELSGAGVVIPTGRDVLDALAAAAEERGLAWKIVATPGARRDGGGGPLDTAQPCYRARVRSIRARDTLGRGNLADAARGWGDTGTAALARALLKWLA